MTRGMTAMIIVLAFTLSFTIASGLGVPASLNLQYGTEYADDVNAVANSIGAGQNASNTGSSVFTDFTVGAGRSLQSGWQMITNTNAVFILLFGLPRVIADMIEVFFRVTYGLMFIQFIRGVVVE